MHAICTMAFVMLFPCEQFEAADVSRVKRQEHETIATSDDGPAGGGLAIREIHPAADCQN